MRIHVHVAFSHKIEMFLKIFIREISNIPLVLCFSHIFIFKTALEIILRMISLPINMYFYLTVPFCTEHDNVVHRWIDYGKTYNLTYNMLKSMVKCRRYCHLFQHTRYHQIDKNTTTTVKRYVNVLVSTRTMCHLIEEKYQVTGHYLCTKYIMGYPELHFLRVCNGGTIRYGRL